ncbi:MAG: hypothetical protein CL947_04290 [Epsilonproteobacteria bacterium]|nr:hypothetical protein [Campylobacterota bacterium]|tara:strand:- start:358 stop:1029 length:672 start_codon:yes stop_codon:yes gene_type:complete
MRLELIDGVRLVIIAFLAYIPTTTISGWFTAWVAKKCGDDVPENFGFLTLDPFAHFSLFGFAFLLVGQLFGNYLTIFKGFPGFGRFIILDPPAHGSKSKAIVEFFARAVSHFIMLTLAAVLLLKVFGPLFAVYMVPSSLWMQQVGPLLVACKDIIVFFLGQNIVLFTIYFLFGIADTICFWFHIPRMFSTHYFAVLVVTLLLLSDIVHLVVNQYMSLLQAILS